MHSKNCVHLNENSEGGNVGVGVGEEGELRASCMTVSPLPTCVRAPIRQVDRFTARVDTVMRQSSFDLLH